MIPRILRIGVMEGKSHFKLDFSRHSVQGTPPYSAKNVRLALFSSSKCMLTWSSFAENGQLHLLVSDYSMYPLELS
jgi:hypothetical protein